MATLRHRLLNHWTLKGKNPLGFQTRRHHKEKELQVSSDFQHLMGPQVTWDPTDLRVKPAAVVFTRWEERQQCSRPASFHRNVLENSFKQPKCLADWLGDTSARTGGKCWLCAHCGSEGMMPVRETAQQAVLYQNIYMYIQYNSKRGDGKNKWKIKLLIVLELSTERTRVIPPPVIR